MDKFVVKDISSGHLSSGVSPRLSFPASAGGNPQQFAPTKPECHHEYQGLWNSWTGHGAYCSQWQRIILWSTSQGEIPQPIIFCYGNMAMITTMLFRVSHLTLPHQKSTSWLGSGATNCRTLTMLPFQGSLCSFLCFVNVDISRLKCFFCNCFRSGDAVYVAEIGPNRLRKFEVRAFDKNLQKFKQQ